MLIFFIVFAVVISTLLFVQGKIFGGTGGYTQLLRGAVLSLSPLFMGIGIISLVMQLSTTLALIVLWPTAGLTLINMWCMFKHYHEIRGWRLFLATLLGMVSIAALCMVLALLFASTART